MERISPRVDIAFKKIFGVEENKDLLISLINSIVGEDDQVSEITLLNPYNPQSFTNDKLSILDIKARGMDGKRFNIEIQISDEADYDKRALYYWAKLYTEQLQRTEDYSRLSKAIGIHILNFTSILSTDKYHNVFQIREKESEVPLFKDLELHTIELKKFCQDGLEELQDLIAKIKTSLDLWVAFLTRHDLLNKDKLPPALDTPSLKKALTVLDVMNFDHQEREEYESHLKWLRIEMNTLKKAEDKGKTEGLEQGRAEGLEQGRAEGLEQGRVEGLEQGIIKGSQKSTLNIAQNMKNQGLSYDQIILFTGLSLQEIQENLS
ncbi:MAG: Rpn family recombination-promoting nuclease/putative transposase [Candidatus Rhabdochlamydia sp.]